MYNIDYLMPKKYEDVIHLDSETALLVKQVRKLWPVPKTQLLKLAWPRCPVCGGPLVQKFASNRLVCAQCNREFTLSEVRQ